MKAFNTAGFFVVVSPAQQLWVWVRNLQQSLWVFGMKRWIFLKDGVVRDEMRLLEYVVFVNLIG